jgi:Tfp pilus assembly protein PilX
MTPPRPRRAQRGNSLLLAMIVMSALGTLGSLTVVSVQGVLKSSTNDRSQAIAMYAAESGAAAAMVTLREHYLGAGGWSTYVHANNDPLTPLPTTDMPSNEAQPGTPQNLLSPDQNAWYSVTILNNVDDPRFHDGALQDSDGQVIIRSTGHGPQGSLAIIEIEVRRLPADPPPGKPPSVPPDVVMTVQDAQHPPLILVGWHVLF